jgi:hypothetical protein
MIVTASIGIDVGNVVLIAVGINGVNVGFNFTGTHSVSPLFLNLSGTKSRAIASAVIAIIDKRGCWRGRRKIFFNKGKLPQHIIDEQKDAFLIVYIYYRRNKSKRRGSFERN